MIPSPNSPASSAEFGEDSLGPEVLPYSYSCPCSYSPVSSGDTGISGRSTKKGWSRSLSRDVLDVGSYTVEVEEIRSANASFNNQ
jgi:hypothetical protein